MFEALKLSSAEVAEHEEEIRLRVRELADEDRKYYFQIFKSEMKDPDTYAVLNWFFIAGLHHMYLGHWLRGCLNLGILLAGLVMMATPFLPIGIAMITILLIVELMALFRSQTVVAHHNNMLGEQILAEIVPD